MRQAPLAVILESRASFKSWTILKTSKAARPPSFYTRHTFSFTMSMWKQQIIHDATPTINNNLGGSLRSVWYAAGFKLRFNLCQLREKFMSILDSVSHALLCLNNMEMNWGQWFICWFYVLTINMEKECRDSQSAINTFLNAWSVFVFAKIHTISSCE